MDPLDALSSVAGLAVEVDGVPVAPGELAVVLGARRVRADALQAESGWWFVQDRLVLAGRRELSRGVHAVAVDFQLLVPYLRHVPVRRWSCRSIWRPGWSLTGRRCPASPATWPEQKAHAHVHAQWTTKCGNGVTRSGESAGPSANQRGR